MRLFFPNLNVHSYEKHVIEENRKYWEGSPNITSGSEWIYVYHNIPFEFEVGVHESLIAKGLQEREQLPIAAVTFSVPRKEMDELDASFGIKEIFHLEFYRIKTLTAKIRASVMAGYYACATYKRKRKLFNIKYRGISCGENIHDEIIRVNCIESRGEQFDCFDISLLRYYYYIRDALSAIDMSYEIFRKRNPRYVVTTEHTYIKSLFCSVASRMGAELLLSDLFYPHIITQIHPNKDLFKNIHISDFLRTQIESYANMMKVQDAPVDNRFLLKTTEELGKDLIERLGIRNDRKNVFIMLHAIIDSSRVSSRQTIYDDYNQWFLDTLRIIKGVKNVNWIIKDHPLATFYYQDDYIKKVFEENKTENMYWCDKKISGMEIKEIADCVITCCGDVGIEYWSYGIPTVTTSEAYYCGWGISYNMKSLREYEDTLQHIGSLKPPPAESIERAQNLLTVAKKMKCGGDKLTCLFREIVEMQLWCGAESGDIQEIPTYLFCKRYRMLLKDSALKSSEIYQLKNVFDIQPVQED